MAYLLLTLIRVLVAVNGIVFAQRVSFPVVGHEDAPHVRMIAEHDSEHIEHFAFVPIRGAPDGGDRIDLRLFAADVHAAAAVITYCTPGLRFFQQGQCEGHRVRVSPHLVRAPQEPVDARLAAFYARLLELLRRPVLRDGQWSLLDCHEAWGGNSSVQQFIAWQWERPGAPRLCVVVNYAPQQGQCFVQLPWPELAGRGWRWCDLLGDAVYERPGDDLQARGLYVDLPPWGHHVFEVQNAADE